jgi:hypothetical protein
MSILQCGQWIFSPMACGGNSMCPLQKKQIVLRNGVLEGWSTGELECRSDGLLEERSQWQRRAVLLPIKR